MLQDFDSNDTVSVTPKKAVDYDICTKVEDANGVVDKRYLVVSVE